jgi:hypothetical protein
MYIHGSRHLMFGGCESTEMLSLMSRSSAPTVYPTSSSSGSYGFSLVNDNNFTEMPSPYYRAGTMAGCGQFVGELEPDRLGRAYVFLNKVSILFVQIVVLV